MIAEYKNRTEFLAWKDLGIRVIYTKKELGNVMEMPLSLLEKELNLPPKRIITGKQSHSDHIAIIREKEIFYFQDNDGFITDRKDIILYTKYADCMPVFLLDTRNMVISVVHSGWKGSFQKIGCKALEKMCQSYNTKTEDIEVLFGVGISPKHYEVGKEFLEQFQTAFSSEMIWKSFQKEGDKYYYDNQEFISQSLLEAGVKPENIFRNTLCSFEGNYHSYRRDREQAGRNGAFIYFEK
ncbi:peptidoglycan editing factor PgeF [Fusobacterium necrophorum]|uniref:peptidoglycan editing factor PgeF n=1 Tax=Fusobacterium necrophorum TaxID=859 RepID=UPI00254F0BED|nr:peptidoglycan editing factor PgeF [Fusobacterium necrophorum]MDK4502454.1 peptidoglycan editing factor PgeF [Fusobacterium necrophorum]